MSSGDELDCVALSLPRPLAGAVARGHVRCLSVEQFAVALNPGGLLLVIHANDVWVPEDLSILCLPRKSYLVEEPDGPPIWEACPPSPAGHPTGLVGVGLLHRVSWAPANGAELDDEVGAQGPWVLGLRDMVTFKTPAQVVGYPGLFALPGQLAGKIITAWENRPPEEPPPSTDAWTPEAGGEVAP